MIRLLRTATTSFHKSGKYACATDTFVDFFPFLYSAVLVSITLCVHWPALSGPFVFDDSQLADPGALAPFVDPRVAIKTTRPLLMISYAVNYWLAGLNPFGFHLVNVLLHCCNGLLLWWNLQAVLSRTALNSSISVGWCRVIVYGTPLLFVVSPIQTESVAYVSSRSELLAATFYLLALRVFLSRWNQKRRWIAVGMIAFLYACSIASKQHAVSLPLAFLLIEFLLLSRPWEEAKATFIMYGVLITEMFAGLFIAGKAIMAAPSAGFFMARVKWTDYLLTQFRVCFLYLRLLIFPFGLNVDHDILPSHNLFDRLSWLALAGLLILAGASIYCRKALPLVSFGILFFLITLAPSSSFFPLADYAAEHRLYLPSIGFFLAALALGAAIWPTASKLPWLGLVLILCIYAVGTVERSRVWADNLALWADAARKSPRKYRAQNNLGVEYIRRQRYDEAAKALAAARELVEPDSADHARVLNNLGLTYANRGLHAQAIQYYEDAILIIDLPTFRTNLAISQMRGGAESQGWQNFDRAVQVSNGDPTIRLAKAEECLRQGRYADAIAEYKEILSRDPHFDVAIKMLAVARQRFDERDKEQVAK